MKKLALTAFISSVMTVGTAFADDTPATLVVTGKLLSSLNCTPVLDRTVANLGTASIDTLPIIGESYAGAVSEDTYFVDFKGDGCANMSYGVKFIGAADPTGQALENTLTGEGAATGIAVNMYDSQGNLITPNTGTKLVGDIYNQHYPFHLNMAKISDALAKPGNVQASLTVEVVAL